MSNTIARVLPNLLAPDKRPFNTVLATFLNMVSSISPQIKMPCLSRVSPVAAKVG